MRQAFQEEEGMADIKFIVVNYNSPLSHRRSGYLRSFGEYDFYQDSLASDVWGTLNGQKDDFLIYDRCGQLTYHIPLPYSDLRFQVIEAAIRSTQLGTDPCTCSTGVTEEAEELLTTLVVETEDPSN